MTHLPVFKTCFLCETEFAAEWARRDGAWFVSEMCLDCEDKLRRQAA